MNKGNAHTRKIELTKELLRLRLRDIKPLLKAGKGYRTGEIQWHYYLDGEIDIEAPSPLSATISYLTEFYGEGGTPDTLLIKWRTSYGLTGEQHLCLIRKPSNLGTGEVFYFLCPLTSKPCRKIYFIQGVWCSAHAFAHIYPVQKMGKKKREERFLYEAPPEKWHGRVHHRGRLTPYGKRLQKWESNYEKAGARWESGVITELYGNAKKVGAY